MTYVLVDCNNFFVSCERLFNPKLERRPVVILSNNDGIIIARSEEAKKLGIGMGEPFFKVRDFCRVHRVLSYSSNFQLYGNLSDRIMSLLRSAAPEIQIYSIDEAFLRFPKASEGEELVNYCKEVRSKVKRWVGIPVSMGIGPTKTLAKAANKIAKQRRDGVFDLREAEVQQKILKRFAVGDIWGVGRNWEEKLHSLGIRTAEEFRNMDPVFVRKQMGVMGERMLRELQGIGCLSLEAHTASKSIMCSRSFSLPLTNLDHLSEAISTYAASACQKLRAQKSCVQAICVWVEALGEGNDGRRHSQSGTASFPLATQDTPEVIASAKQIIAKLFCTKERYKKCGIILLDLIPEKNVIPDFFLGGIDPKRTLLTRSIDRFNAKRGKEAVFYAAMGTDRPWKMRCENRSKRYTTCWNELALVT